MKSFGQWREVLENDPKHMIGNPVFAIETNLNPLRKRITEGRTAEALEIVESIEASINQIKQFLGTIQ